MRAKLAIAAVAALLAAPAFADSHAGMGDVEKGESVFKKCKSCHAITDADGEKIVKGGRNGPNLYGVIGRVAGVDEVFGKKYSKSMVAAGEAGLVWDEATFVEYVQDPSKFLKTYLDDKKAKGKMAFKLKKDMADVYAYLATFSPAMDMEEGAEEAEATSG